VKREMEGSDGTCEGSADTTIMLINSSELRAAGFKLKEVLPPAPEATARGGWHTL